MSATNDGEFLLFLRGSNPACNNLAEFNIRRSLYVL